MEQGGRRGQLLEGGHREKFADKLPKFEFKSALTVRKVMRIILDIKVYRNIIPHCTFAKGSNLATFYFAQNIFYKYSL